MMRFFTNGTWCPRLAAIEVSTPVGERCLACGETIAAEDCGVSMLHMDGSYNAYRPWHLACFRTSLGVEGDKA